MARGKQTCKILKDIRRQIAEANDIEFITSECQFQGDCLGTCPKCAAALRDLDTQLTLRRMAGKAIVVAGLSAGMLTLASCSNQKQNSDNYNPEYDEEYNVDVHENDDDDFFEGEIEGEVVSDDYYEDANDCDNENKQPVTKILITGDPDFDDEKWELERDSIYKANDWIFQIDRIDSKPEFPGGEQAMYDWIKSHVTHPAFIDWNSKIDSVVIWMANIELIIDKTGAIEKVDSYVSMNPELNDEIIKAFESMPAWKPAVKDGDNVKCSIYIPIRYIKPQDY